MRERKETQKTKPGDYKKSNSDQGFKRRLKRRLTNPMAEERVNWGKIGGDEVSKPYTEMRDY